MALKLGGRKFVFSNKAPLYRSFFFSMVRIDVYRRERVLVVSTSDARFIWWNGAERAGLFFCLGCFEIYSGLVEILFMSRAVSLMQSKVGNIKFFVYVYIYIYSFSGYYCFYQTNTYTPSDLSHFILIYIALMNASDHVFEWSIVSAPTFLHCK